LTALGEWSEDQADKQTELLTSFMEPVLAALLEFAKLEDEHMKESPAVVRIHEKVMKTLHQIISAKSIRTEFTNISTMLKDAMVLLDQALGVFDYVLDVKTNQIVQRIQKIAEETQAAVR
jgi:phosphomevalonate kinase